MTPCTMLVSRPYPNPPPPLGGGRWGDLAAPNSVLPLTMGRKRPGGQVDSALRAMNPLVESLPIVDYLYHYLLILGLR